MLIRTMWNGKFSREGYLYGKQPNRFLAGYIDHMAPGSSILFLGEGEGRNACYAASKGHRAVALDASEIGLEKAQRLAHELGVDIWTIHTDLAQWHADSAYDAVMASFLHLNEPLRAQAFREALKALKASGVFAAEFFSTKQLPRTSGGPKDIDLLYTVDSLREIFSVEGIEILSLEEVVDQLDEGSGHQGEAELIRIVARKCEV